MTGQKVETDTLVSRVATAIEDGIREGRFLPGHKLIEQDLARELKVSRVPIREAFRRLAAQRILEIRPRRGAYVRKLTRSEAHYVLDMLQALGQLAVTRAAERIDMGSNRELLLAKVSAEELERTQERMAKEWVDVNYPFHRLIAEISGNPLLPDLNHQLQMQMYRLVSGAHFLNRTRHSTIDDHKAIGEAILAGDPAAAVAAYRTHVQHAREAIESLPDSAFADE